MSVRRQRRSIGALELGLPSIDVTVDEATEKIVAEASQTHAKRVHFDAHEIVSGVLWVGSMRSLKATKTIQDKGIRHIINMSQSELSPEVAAHFDVLRIDVADSAAQTMFSAWEASIRRIEAASELGEATLVVCQRGISRSVATACAYLMKTNHVTWDSALLKVQQSRQVAAPNFEFCCQLYVFGLVDFDAHAALEQYDVLAEGFQSELELQRLGLPVRPASLLEVDEEFSGEYTSSAGNTPSQSLNTSTSSTQHPHTHPHLHPRPQHSKARPSQHSSTEGETESDSTNNSVASTTEAVGSHSILLSTATPTPIPLQRTSEQPHTHSTKPR